VRRFFQKTGPRPPAIAARTLFIDPVGELCRPVLLLERKVAVGVGRCGFKVQDREGSVNEQAIAAVGELVDAVREGVFEVGFEHGVLRLGLCVQGEDQEKRDEEAQQTVHDAWPLRRIAPPIQQEKASASPPS